MYPLEQCKIMTAIIVSCVETDNQQKKNNADAAFVEKNVQKKDRKYFMARKCWIVTISNALIMACEKKNTNKTSQLWRVR